MFTINEKRHIKNLFHTIKFFFNPIQKKNGIKKNKFSYNSINKQSNSFDKKTFLILKKQDTENLTKKTTGKKNPWLYFIKSLKKINKWIKKTSNQTRHCTTLQEPKQPRARKKTESTTKQSHIRTHKKKPIFFNQTKLVLIHNNIFLHWIKIIKRNFFPTQAKLVTNSSQFLWRHQNGMWKFSSLIGPFVPRDINTRF